MGGAHRVLNLRFFSSALSYERTAVALVFGVRVYLVAFTVLSIAASVLYAFLLPSLPEGTLNFYAIHFITPLQVLFAIVFGSLISLVIVFSAYAFRLHVASAHKLTLSAVAASLVNCLCCTPIIPSMIALTGASTPILFAYSPPIQAFFEYNYPYFYLLSTLILVASLHYTCRNISRCGRITIGK